MQNESHDSPDGGAPLLDPSLLQETLTVAMRTGGEFAEVFVEDRRGISALFDDGRVEELTSGRDRGAGVRVVVGDTTGFAHTADLSRTGLRAAAEAAAAAARGGGGGVREVVLAAGATPAVGPVEVMPGDVPKADKVALLERADVAARSSGGAITQVAARYADSHRRILIANSDLLLTGVSQVRTLFSVSFVATGDMGMQTGRESVGHTVGFELFDRVVDIVAEGAGPQPGHWPEPTRQTPPEEMRAKPGNGYTMRETFIKAGIARLKEELPEPLPSKNAEAAE